MRFNQRRFAEIRGQFISVAFAPGKKEWTADSREFSRMFSSIRKFSPEAERRRFMIIRVNSPDSRSGFLLRVPVFSFPITKLSRDTVFNQRRFAEIRGQFISVAFAPGKKEWPADSREFSRMFSSMRKFSPEAERRRYANIRVNSLDARFRSFWKKRPIA
jgi:hypothetical protein